MPSYWKEDQLANATSQKQREKQARKKGQEAEKKALAELCNQIGRKPGPGDRQNNQRREGGGLSIPDISIKGLDGWHSESKAENNYRFPAYWKQLREDCPANKRPALIFTCNTGEQFLQIRLKDLANLAQDVVLAAGFEII
jgi:hypothetical protein